MGRRQYKNYNKRMNTDLDAFLAWNKVLNRGGSVASSAASSVLGPKPRKQFVARLQSYFDGPELGLVITQKVLVSAGMNGVTDAEKLRSTFKSGVLAPLRTRVKAIAKSNFVYEKLESIVAQCYTLTESEQAFYNAFAPILCAAFMPNLKGDEAVRFAFNLIARTSVLTQFKAMEKAAEQDAARQKNKAAAAGGK